MDPEVAKPPSIEPSKVLQAIKMVSGIAGGIAGYALGSYAFAYLLIPGICALVAGALLFRIVPKSHVPIVGACAIQIGHGLWMFIGMAVIVSMQLEAQAKLNPFDLIDVFILVGVSVWLAFQPGWIPCGILAIYQVFGIAINVFAVSEQPAGGPLFKALLVHLFLRVIALAAMAVGMYEVRKTLAAAKADAGELDEVEEEDDDDGEEESAIDENPYRPRKN